MSKDFEAMKAGKLAIWPKSQFLFHKNLPPRDFSIMTLVPTLAFVYSQQIIGLLFPFATKKYCQYNVHDPGVSECQNVWWGLCILSWDNLHPSTHYVLKLDFTWTFPGSKYATLK